MFVFFLVILTQIDSFLTHKIFPYDYFLHDLSFHLQDWFPQEFFHFLHTFYFDGREKPATNEEVVDLIAFTLAQDNRYHVRHLRSSNLQNVADSYPNFSPVQTTGLFDPPTMLHRY